jgi:hypothetical protein
MDGIETVNCRYTAATPVFPVRSSWLAPQGALLRLRHLAVAVSQRGPGRAVAARLPAANNAGRPAALPLAPAAASSPGTAPVPAPSGPFPPPGGKAGPPLLAQDRAHREPSSRNAVNGWPSPFRVLQVRRAGRHGPRDAPRTDSGFRLAVPCPDTPRAFEHLQAALQAHAGGLLIQPTARARLKGKLQIRFVLYIEDLLPEELAGILRQARGADWKAESNRRGDGQFGGLVVTRLSKDDRPALATLPGVDPRQLPAPRPGAPPGLGPKKPLAEDTAGQVSRALAGQGSTSRTGPNKPAARPSEHLAAVRPHNPVWPRPRSAELRRFLDGCKPPRGGTVAGGSSCAGSGVSSCERRGGRLWPGPARVRRQEPRPPLAHQSATRRSRTVGRTRAPFPSASGTSCRPPAAGRSGGTASDPRAPPPARPGTPGSGPRCGSPRPPPRRTPPACLPGRRTVPGNRGTPVRNKFT